MIDRELLLKVARGFAEERGRERATIVAGFLIGSVARSEPPLGDSTDLDICLIDNDPPLNYERFQRVSDTILIDCWYNHPNVYQDKPYLRGHALLGPSLYDAVPLYDPRHMFDLIQASVRGQFDVPENVYARARQAYRQAREHFDAIERYRAVPVPVPLDRDELHHLHAIFEWASTAILMITFRSHTNRRQMMQFEAAASELERSDLYARAMEGLGFTEIVDDEIATMREQWHDIYNASNRFHSGLWDEGADLHPTREYYYLRGFEALAEAGHAQNSLLLLENILGACANHILNYAPPEDAVTYLEMYTSWLAQTRKGSTEDFAERVSIAGELLEQIDDVLIAWARTEGVAI